MVRIEEVTEAHINYLLEHLSEADRVEIQGLGYTPEWALRHSLDNAVEKAAITWHGRLVVILGVGLDNPYSENYTPWLLGTEEVKEHPVKVMKYSFKVLKAWLGTYGTLVNYVDQRHTRAYAWLQALGAKFELVPDHGPYKRPYYKFTFGA